MEYDTDSIMAPTAVFRDVAHTALRSAAIAAAPLLARESITHLERRDLTVTDTQKVTLGVIAAYVVGIALLWNIPYVRNVLWPFKVSLILALGLARRLLTYVL